MQARQKDETRPRKKYNPYGDDFVVNRIDLKKIVEEVVGLEEITVSQDIDIVDDHNVEWVDDWSKPEVEFDDEQQQSYEQHLTNLRVLEWLNETTSDPEETSVTIQDVDRESMKYIKTERDDPSWAAQEGRLLIPASNLDLIPGMRSTGTSMDIFVRGVGVGLTHTENLIIKKLRIARETGDLEAETGEEPKKPDIGRVVESYFNLPNEYSSNIILTDSDFILTNRTCAIAITAEMSFRTALAADFKREYKNVEFLWKQRPGIGGVAALPPAVSQIPGKYLCFLVTRATEKQHVDPENLVLSLTRLRDFLVNVLELNDLCRRNTQQAQARQRKRFDKKAAGAKAYSVGDYVWVFQNVIPPKGTKKLLKKWRGPFMITEVHQEGRFYRLSTGRAAHYENIKPHNPSTEDWCIPADMEEGDYLMMDPACEVNEKGTREKNDGNEIVEEGTDTPLDLDPNERIEADDEILPYAEEDWQDPEQIEVPKNLEPDLPFTMQTRQKDETRPRKKYNPYGDDFVVDRIDLKKIVEEVVGLEEITVSQDIDIVDDHKVEWVDDWSKPEVEFDDEQQQSYEQDLTNLRVLEWLNETTSDPEETSVTIQDVDRESMKYIKTERDDPSWAAQEGRLLIPASNFDLIPGMRSTGTSMDIFVRGVGVGLTHTENLIIKKLRIARETGDLEAETGEEPKKPDIGRVVESYFNLPNEYSSNIILTDSDFILTNRTCAIAITAEMSFRTALAADFKREYKNVEFLWKQRPGIGGVAALPPAVSQIPGKYLCFLVTRATEKQHVDPENLVLSLTRLRETSLWKWT